jgi:hypothetical protein
MAKRMEVPPELQHLIEKRDEDADRRKGERRGKQSASGEQAANKAERRTTADRRGKRRRKSG